MKKNLQKLFVLLTVFIAVNASAQNQVYWREGFEPSSTPACDLTTTNPTSITPAPTSDISYYFNGVGGSWYAKNAYRTTGTNCGNGTNHVRFRNMGTTGTFDSGTLITPVVDYGIQEFHFLRARASRTYSLWVTNDTGALTTNWTFVTKLNSWANTTCQDTTVVIGSATAKRLKIITRAGLDVDIDSVYITSFSQIMPVKFNGVSASEANGIVKLNWNVATELNTNSYVIERSTNGDNYVAIGTVSLNKSKAYTWVDKTANAGANFYRIKAVDNNGSYMYSNAVKLTIGKNKSEFNVYPNPVSDSRLNIQLSGITSGNYKVNIYGMNGSLVYTTSLNSAGTSLANTIDLPSAVRAGTYTLEITNGSFKTVKSILVK